MLIKNKKKIIKVVKKNNVYQNKGSTSDIKSDKSDKSDK